MTIAQLLWCFIAPGWGGQSMFLNGLKSYRVAIATICAAIALFAISKR